MLKLKKIDLHTKNEKKIRNKLEHECCDYKS